MQSAKVRYTENDRAQRKKWCVLLGSFNQKGAKLYLMKTMSFTSVFPNLSGATDVLESFANLHTPSPKLLQPADHLGKTVGNRLGILANTEHITVKTLKFHVFRDAMLRN